MNNIRKKLLKKFIGESYYYVAITKKSIIVVCLIIFFILLTSAGTFAYSQGKLQPFLSKTAIWLYEKPLIGTYIQAKWLPTDYILSQVLPMKGYQTKITLGDIVQKMVAAGIIDPQKLNETYKARGGTPREMKELLSKPSHTPILVTKETSSWLINILWPLGLSNKMVINEKSPIAGKDVGNFASTGGWTLGKEENGGAYFNSVELIQLSQNQEQRVKALADSIYRPCCNNSSFFQDCNHGSAALALIELGVAQGLRDDEIYKTLLVFNSFWFPQNYTETALYFQYAKNTVWDDIDPKLLLSKEYSSASGWIASVDIPAQKIPNLLPALQSGGGCSV
ncbi:MAG: hypothetical protein HY430_00455 [Candidatus Levybacteria bacterium]|nr:hypothetical protein [Candidatus Levybacteria bacterium]